MKPIEIERITWTLKEAQEFLGVGNSVMYELAHRKDFPAFKFARGKWYVHSEKLKAWVDDQC